MCLPPSRRNRSSCSTIAYPRGRYRSELGSMGLIGKIHLTSEMTEADIKHENRTAFRGPMSGDPNFPFLFLQPAGEGAKCLIIPAQSSTYRWTAQQVARLGGQKNTIYILAQADMQSLKSIVSSFLIRVMMVLTMVHALLEKLCAVNRANPFVSFTQHPLPPSQNEFSDDEESIPQQPQLAPSGTAASSLLATQPSVSQTQPTSVNQSVNQLQLSVNAQPSLNQPQPSAQPSVNQPQFGAVDPYR